VWIARGSRQLRMYHTWKFLKLLQPGHVFVAVSSSLSFTMEQTFFLDVFNQGTILTYDELSSPLSQGGSLPLSILRPAGVCSMMCRVAGNIINSINREPTTNGLQLPWLAALSAITILESDHYLYRRLCDFIRNTPSLCDTDIDIIEQACIHPAVGQFGDRLEFCRLARHQDTVGRLPKRRASEYSSVRFTIGQIFKHRLFQFDPYVNSVNGHRYVGVIYGYDNHCNQSVAWKENMV